MRLYCQNWSDESIIEYVNEKFDVHDKRSISNYLFSTKAACDLRLEKYRDDIAQNNMRRLNQVIDEAWEKGDHKTVLAATEQLNKMGGCYSQAIEVKTEEPIRITFEGE